VPYDEDEDDEWEDFETNIGLSYAELDHAIALIGDYDTYKSAFRRFGWLSFFSWTASTATLVTVQEEFPIRRRRNDSSDAELWQFAASGYYGFWTVSFLFWAFYTKIDSMAVLFKNWVRFSWFTGLLMLTMILAVPTGDDEYHILLWIEMGGSAFFTWVLTLFYRHRLMDYVEARQYIREYPELVAVSEWWFDDEDDYDDEEEDYDDEEEDYED